MISREDSADKRDDRSYNFEIFIGPDDIYPRNETSIIMPISVKCGEYYFPSKKWTDFAVIVLNWWCDEVAFLGNQCSCSAALTFMDGPYEIQIRQTLNEELCDVKFVMLGKNSPLADFKCSPKQIRAAVIGAAENLLGVLRKINYWDGECDQLKSAASSLSSNVR